MSNTTEVLIDNADELKDKMMTELIELLREDKFKKDLVKAINKDINIPMINEKTEKKVFDALYDLLVKETEPGEKGNTAQGATKPATLESGLIVFVPLLLIYFSGPVGLVIYWMFRIFYARKIGFHE